VLAQAVINIGGVVDALPVTGIPLPFISYGGSSLVLVLIAVGLLFGIARRQPAAVPRRSAPGARLLPVAVSTYPDRTGPPSRRRSRAEPA
jgi:cell division protein FtsW